MASRIIAVVLTALSLSAAFSLPAHADEDAELRAKVEDIIKDMRKDEDLRSYFKGTRRFETEDKNFKMKIGGRIQLDYWFFEDEDIEAAGGGTWS